jgi:HlyD family secretion protein
MDEPSLPSLPLEHNGKAPPPAAAAAARPGAAHARPARRWPWLVLVAGLAAAVALAVGNHGTEDPPADLAAGAALDVVALGRLMPRGDLVRIAPPFGAGDARIARLHVGEGEAVRAGTVIAELDSLPVLQAAVDAAEANLAAQQSALEKARANVDSSLREAAAELGRARSAATLAASQAERQRSLFARQLIARAALEEAESNEVRAARELDRATAQWQRQQGDERQPDVALALTQREVARQTLAQARAQLAGGRVLAPFDGTLVTLHARVGEKIGSEGIASFGDLTTMQAELEVYQTDIARVAPGQAVSLSSPALDRPLTGEVERIGLEVERQAVLASDPAANTDARVVRVLVTIDDADRERAARLSGLDVTGRLQATP